MQEDSEPLIAIGRMTLARVGGVFATCHQFPKEFNPLIERDGFLLENAPELGSFDFWDWFTKPRNQDESTFDDTLKAVLKYGGGLMFALTTFRLFMKMERTGVFRRFLTYHLSETRIKSMYTRLRDAFREVEYFPVNADPAHSHGVVAASRAAANNLMSAIVSRVGLNKYIYQMSVHDQKKDNRGLRSYFWSSDLKFEPQFDKIDRHDVIIMTDVDYYVDMNEELCYNNLPHLLYTVTPTSAGYHGTNYSYHFNDDQTITWSVSGGAEYTHELWCYSTDTVVATQKFCGIPYKAVLYDVQQRSTEADKSVIGLFPISTHYGLSAIWTYFKGNPLVRFTMCKDKFAKVVVRTKEDKLVSVARVGSQTSATVPLSTFESLISTRMISPKGQLSLYQVKAHLQDSKDKDVMAPILMHYLNTTEFDVKPVDHIETPTMVAYSFAVPDPTDKPVMTSFMNPLITPGFVPLKNADCSDQSIRGRVLEPREKAKEVLGEFKMTNHKLQCLEFFMNHLVPLDKRHKAVAYDFLEVQSRQVKPGQLRDLQTSGYYSNYSGIIKTFMKAEVYGKPTDPRNISTFDSNMKIPYAAYIYPVMDMLKNYPFYAFGNSPREVAARVSEICANSKMVVCQDVTRMDGYVNEFCRQIEAMLLTHMYPVEQHAEILELHAASYNNAAVTSFGTWYDQEFSRGSGEMGTSAFNTILTLFMMFLAYVYDGYTMDEAWIRLKLYCVAGGDDGVAGDVSVNSVIRSGRDVGFIVKAPFYERGETGVNFLARIYGPEVWHGDPNSMCSLRRQLEKFHMTQDLPISPEQKLYEKAFSFWLTDENTPVIGVYVNKVLELANNFKHTGSIVRFWDQYPKDEQYINIYEDWMDQVMVMELETESFDVAGFYREVESAKALSDLLNIHTHYMEGREFTYPGFSPEPGRLIATTYSVYGKSKPDLPKARKAKKVKFGSFKEEHVLETVDKQ